MNNEVMFSSKKEDWETPGSFFDELNKEFDFNLDAAASDGNAKCNRYLTEEEDALNCSWGMSNWFRILGYRRKSRVFLNPPYGKTVGLWVAKSVEEVSSGNAEVVVMLLPARTDTQYFHKYIWDNEQHCPRSGVEVRFVKGRLKFGGATNSAPFPSMVVVFRGVS